MNPNNSSEALAQLQQVQAQSQNPNTILSGQRQEMGAQAAQDTVTGLRGAINNTTKLLRQVAPSVMGRTANSLVTNAQATKQISNEQAPISQTLSDQGSQLGEAVSSADRLEEQARQAANGIYQGQQDRLSYAQNLYNSLYQRERDAEAARQAEMDRQEQIRQFNAQLSQSGRGGMGDVLSSLFGGGSQPGQATGGATGAQMQKRGDGGFNFTNQFGNAISAAQYAAEKSIPFRELLQVMARQGDKGAQSALGFVGNDYGYDPTKIGGSGNLYNSLVWGTGKSFQAPKAAPSRAGTMRGIGGPRR